MMRAAMSRALAATPVASLAFVSTLALAAIAVRNGLVTDDVLRLWAGASTAADGQVPLGRIVAAYPTLPFMTTTLVAWLAPANTPVPMLAAAGLVAVIATYCFLSLRKKNIPVFAAAAIALLIACHPAMLRAIIDGPGDAFLAVFLLMLCLALYDLRARSGTSEVMNVGLALMALAFSHPMGAAVAFASVPFLAFAVRPTLIANSALNVVVALIFPTLFTIAAFSYVSWVFPGDGWTFFAAPGESLSVWTAAIGQVFGAIPFNAPALDASVAMVVAFAVSAPVVSVLLLGVRRRRPLIDPAAVFVAAVIAATAMSVLSGCFGEPTALVVAAPALAAAVLVRAPFEPRRLRLVISLLVAGWFGGLASLALIDPADVGLVQTAFAYGRNERADALVAGGALSGRDGVLVDIDNAPAFLLGHGGARGILGPQSEQFALAMLFSRIDAPYVAVPDPHGAIGATDRLNQAFPSLYREGLRDYRIIYQNKTWRIFANKNKSQLSGK